MAKKATTAAATTVTVTYKPHTDQAHRTIIGKAEQLLEVVLADASFRMRVENAEYSGGTQFKERSGKVVNKTGREIADIILKGVERDTRADNDLDMTISPFPHRRGIVGSAILGKGPIKPSMWFLDQCAKRSDAISLSRHLIHEWLHVAGFFHRKSGPGQDDVPYQVGDIVRAIAKDPSTRQSLLAAGLNGFLEEDDLAVYYLEEFEDEVEYDPSEW